MLNETELKRLRWRCTHRAQLEVDLLLGHFLDRHFAKLDSEQAAAFAALAELEDIELWPLVMGRRECADPAQARLLAMMREMRPVDSALPGNEWIKTGVSNGVASIEIARPEKKNALTQAMYEAMAAAIEAATANASVRAVLIAGQPGIFTAGNDLEDFLASKPGEGLEKSAASRFMRALIECDKPVVAAVTGAAVGIGTTMLLHCDFVYVSDDARLAMPFVSLGLVPEFASSLLAPQLMGPRRAAEKMLLGEICTAKEAVEWGLANAALPREDVLDHARRVAERFNALPPGAARETKRLLRAPERAAILAAIERENKGFAECLQSPEAREALAAFFEKRKPDFSKF